MTTAIVLLGASTIAGLSGAIVWIEWGEVPSMLFLAGGFEFTALMIASNLVLMRGMHR